MKVKISLGNTKMGKIPSVSLPPIKSCGNCALCSKKCYAMKAYRMFKQTKAAYDNNYEMAMNGRAKYFWDIEHYLAHKNPQYFRWHVSGDILDLSYLFEMNRIAEEYPKTKFLCFTKMYDLVDSFLYTRKFAKNLHMFISLWEDYDIYENSYGVRQYSNLHTLSTARAVYKKDLYKYQGFKCEGNCSECGFCFEALNGSSVIFKMH